MNEITSEKMANVVRATGMLIYILKDQQIVNEIPPVVIQMISAKFDLTLDECEQIAKHVKSKHMKYVWSAKPKKLW
jgi:hypothetical protein